GLALPKGATQNGRGRPCQGLPLTWVSYSAFPQPAALLGGNRRGREVDLDLGFLAGPDCHRLGARLGLAVANHFRLQRVAVLQAALESGGDEHALSGGRGRRIAIDRQHGISREIDDDRRRGRLAAGLLSRLLLPLVARGPSGRGDGPPGAAAPAAAPGAPPPPHMPPAAPKPAPAAGPPVAATAAPVPPVAAPAAHVPTVAPTVPTVASA